MPAGYTGFIDVRDLARMHLDATRMPELAGRRLIAAAPQPVVSQDYGLQRSIIRVRLKAHPHHCS